MSREQDAPRHDDTPYVAPTLIEVGKVADLTQTKSGGGGDTYGAQQVSTS